MIDKRGPGVERGHELVKEVEAIIRLYDVKELQRLRERVQAQWWEPGLRLLVFISGLGFLVTVYKILPRDNTLLFWFVFTWFAVFIVTLVGALECLVVRVRTLTRLYELQCRMLEELEGRIGKPSDRSNRSAQPQVDCD